MTSIYELRRQSDAGIYAVPYKALRRGKSFRLPDGAIVESPLPDQRCKAPDYPDSFFEVGAGGAPATVHHANLGLVVALLSFSGVYFLPNGDVAAVYGAEVLPIGAENIPAA